jgi:hypothetical protein
MAYAPREHLKRFACPLWGEPRAAALSHAAAQMRPQNHRGACALLEWRRVPLSKPPHQFIVVEFEYLSFNPAGDPEVYLLTSSNGVIVAEIKHVVHDCLS